MIQFQVVGFEANTGTEYRVTATNSNNNRVNVYKDGLIRYKNSSGTTIECTKGYYKDSSGNKKAVRYAKYKDNNGAIHIIDVYTTYYE